MDEKLSLSLEKLKNNIPNSVLDQLPSVIEKFNITTILRLTHFLSQCSHESGGFKVVQENLNYSADALKKLFSKYFPDNLADSYARQPIKIASRIYANRMGNGDELTQEGYKYRGKGYLQCTGKSNYVLLSKDLGVDLVANPDLLATEYPLSSAAWFFNKNNLWTICDQGATDDVVTKVTKRVNGGTIGLSERISEFKKFYQLLA